VNIWKKPGKKILIEGKCGATGAFWKGSKISLANHVKQTQKIHKANLIKKSRRHQKKGVLLKKHIAKSDQILLGERKLTHLSEPRGNSRRRRGDRTRGGKVPGSSQTLRDMPRRKEKTLVPSNGPFGWKKSPSGCGGRK